MPLKYQKQVSVFNKRQKHFRLRNGRILRLISGRQSKRLTLQFGHFTNC
jgi:hypothetical protein